MSAHETQHHETGEKVSKTSFKASSWLVIILVGLFIAALNFIQVESKDEPKEGEKSEMATPATPEATEHSATGAQVTGEAAPKHEGATADTTVTGPSVEKH